MHQKLAECLVVDPQAQKQPMSPRKHRSPEPPHCWTEKGGISDRADWPQASGSPDAMQRTPERGKRIGVCKQYLKKKIAVQIQHLLTQVFIGGIIFPGLLSPNLLCKSQLTPVGTFL